MKGLSPAIPSLAMTKALMLSFVIHAAIIAVALICLTGKPAKDQEVITISLADDPGQGGATAQGGAGGTDAGGQLRRSQGRQRFDDHKRGRSLASAEPLSQPPVKPASVDEQPREKTVSATEAHDPPREADAPARSSIIASSTGERPSEGHGKGDGGAGGGTGGDPSGAEGADVPRPGTGVGKGTGDGQSGYAKEQFVYIRDLVLKKLTYPPLARQRGWEGVVLLFFVIRENGTVEQIRVMKSSGHEVLDEHAIKTVKSVQPFPRPPVKAQLILPIAFSLR